MKARGGALINLSYQIFKPFYFIFFFWTVLNMFIEHGCFDNSQLLLSGATRSVRRALTVRTARVCVTVPMVPVATTLMEAACVSQDSTVHTAETECVPLESMGCTVKTPVSARTNTHLGKRLL